MWEWVAEPDACEFCQRMDGTIHEDSESIDGLSHPNCRCSQIPHVSAQEIKDLENVDQDVLIERTIEKLRETIADTTPFKYQPGTIQYKAFKAMKKIEGRANYVRYVYGDVAQANLLIKQYGLEKVYYSADLHPMTRKALLLRSEGKSIEEFKKEVWKAKRDGKVRDRKTFETKESRPDLRRNPFNIYDEPNDNDDDW